MIGLDTNVLVRYIMQDDPKQSPKATSLIESLDADNTGFVSLVSIVELYWVLTSCYALSGNQAVKAIETIVRTQQFVVERADIVVRALRVFLRGGVDLPDCLIERAAASEGCTETFTFDAGAARHAGMTLL